MKLFFGTLLILIIMVLGWLSLGWIAFIVLPFGALAALMAFSGLILEWEKEQAVQSRSRPRRAESPVAAEPAQVRC